jgi:hypothetical protein
MSLEKRVQRPLKLMDSKSGIQSVVTGLKNSYLN